MKGQGSFCMEPITYHLWGNQSSSRAYYEEARRFANEVVNEIENSSGNILSEYQQYRLDRFQKGLSIEETAFEFLVMGTLWRVYSGDASQLDNMPKHVLTELYRLRQKGGSIKPKVDLVRGVMSTLFLSPDLYDHMFILDPSLQNLEILLNWLEAAGEFRYEVKKLRCWQEYLKGLDMKKAEDILGVSMAIAAWFDYRSVEVLGPYTHHVERYLHELRPKHYFKEDVIFCGRRRVEYHLNMVGAEFMNGAFREAFIKTSKKLVIIPGCMRARDEKSCRALDTGKGLACTRCDVDCNVKKLVDLGDEYHFKVLMVSHESAISSQNNGSFIEEGVGVIGVACILNLISGGWMLEEMGVPAQCVLLDYCGCKNHWSKEGISTALFEEQLKKVLGDTLKEG